MQCSYCTNAIHCERHSLRNVELSSSKAVETAETNANFISQYHLHLTSIQRNFCIAEMRQVNSTIWCNYIIIICWNVWCAAIARSHYIKEIVLKFVKTRFESLNTCFFENSNFQLIRTNSNRLSSFIHWSRILSIFRSIIRSIRIFFYKKLLWKFHLFQWFLNLNV